MSLKLTKLLHGYRHRSTNMGFCLYRIPFYSGFVLDTGFTVLVYHILHMQGAHGVLKLGVQCRWMGYNCCFFLNFVPLHIESPYNFGGTGPILGVKNPLQRVNGHAVISIYFETWLFFKPFKQRVLILCYQFPFAVFNPELFSSCTPHINRNIFYRDKTEYPFFVVNVS